MGTATSIDGSTFSFHAAVDGLELQPGSYASVGEHLGQVHTVELLAEERGSVRGEGMLLEGGVAPFHDMTIGRADEARGGGMAGRDAAKARRARRRRAGARVRRVRFSLDAGGFDRHTFFCGQSGSGKTLRARHGPGAAPARDDAPDRRPRPELGLRAPGPGTRRTWNRVLAARYRGGCPRASRCGEAGVEGAERLHVRFVDCDAAGAGGCAAARPDPRPG